MEAPGVRESGRQLSDFVPQSILQSLIASKRPSARVRHNRAEPSPPRRQRPEFPSGAPTALQEEQKLFLADAANLPDTSNFKGQKNARQARHEVPASATQYLDKSDSNGVTTLASKHTYSSKSSKPKLPSARPLEREKLSKPIRSVHEQREKVIGRVAKSRSESSSGISAPGPDKEVESRRGAGAYASLEVMFDRNSTVRSARIEKDAVSPTRRRRPAASTSSPSLLFNSMPRVTGNASDTFSMDAIDMFLVNNNRQSSLPIASGQKFVYDHNKAKNISATGMSEFGGSQAGSTIIPFSSSQTSFAPILGSEEGSAEERVGQFGGLIPTLYTMDTVPQQRRVRVPPNRYHSQVISRDTKVTGAGFRRFASMSSSVLQKDASFPDEAADQEPNQPTEDNPVLMSETFRKHALYEEGALIFRGPAL